MPPPLDLSHSTHAKMMASPRLNLRRAPSYHNEKMPLSATSARFSFNHLLFSPPPSPSLPALVPRPKRSPSRPRPSRVIRLMIWVSGILLTLYVVTYPFRREGREVASTVLSWVNTRSGQEYEMVGQNDLPDFPTPILVTDRWGRSKWTMSTPNGYGFPLSVEEYRDMGARCKEVSSHLRDLHRQAPVPEETLRDPKYVDSGYLDVREAKKKGLLPAASKGQTALNAEGRFVGVPKYQPDDIVPTCAKSLTFVLESEDPGLGRTLMALWIAYGMAQAEKRAFFIDDTRWAYGNFTDIFKPPPVPSCRPAPRHEIVACPRHARHVVVTPDTAQGLWGSSLSTGISTEADRAGALEDPLKQRAVFDLARKGYEALFQLADADAQYVIRRTRVLREQARAGTKAGHEDARRLVGMHIRRGDRRPLEHEYAQSYVPLYLFSDAVGRIAERRHQEQEAKMKPAVPTTTTKKTTSSSGLFPHAIQQIPLPLAGKPTTSPAGPGSGRASRRGPSLLPVVATDDPAVFDADELAASVAAAAPRRAQDHIKLAGKGSDAMDGWAGGFFSQMFWTIGRQGSNDNAASSGGARLVAPTEGETRLRQLLGRAYLLDLAVLEGLGTEVVCAVSATGCRMLAVMMGWEAAFGPGEGGRLAGGEADGEGRGGRWINVEKGFAWPGVPVMG